MATIPTPLQMTCLSCSSITHLDLPHSVTTLVLDCAAASTSEHVEELWLELAGICHGCSVTMSV